jgi:pectin methylesterase-like acyl-CoA thioesterase
MIKADNLENRCPWTCSGTPAATYGCSDGALDAENQINRLLEKYSAKQVQAYLQSIAVSQEAKTKIAPYFPKGPRPDQNLP